MSDVETVALWAGLIVGIASVVLAIVAIYFSIEVDRRSSRATAESIKSLERIESAVTSQSRDTRDLIKVGWERMLSNVDSPREVSGSGDSDVQAVAAGIAAELRDELGLSDPYEGGNEGERLEAVQEALDDLRDSIATQIRAARTSPSEQMDFWLDQASALSQDAIALGRVLDRHLTWEQSRRLRERGTNAYGAFEELREEGFLIPLEGYASGGRKTSVYWFPPGLSRVIRHVFILSDAPDDLEAFMEAELREVGYPDVPGGDNG